MRCPNCGEETNSSICPNCGTKIVRRKKKTCPNCGSENIKYKKKAKDQTTFDKYVEMVDKATHKYTPRMTAICQECGTKWETKVRTKHSSLKWWQWILIVVLFPVTLSVMFWKTKKIRLDKKIRKIILLVLWIAAILGIIIFGYKKASAAAAEKAAQEAALQAAQEAQAQQEAEEAAAAEEEARRAEEEAKLQEETDKNKPNYVVKYTTDLVNVREEPNTDCEKLALLQMGRAVNVVEERDDGWSHITYNDVDGYIRSDFLTDVNPLTTQTTEETDTTGTTGTTGTQTTTTTAAPTTTTQPAAPTTTDTAAQTTDAAAATTNTTTEAATTDTAAAEAAAQAAAAEAAATQ